MVARSFGAAAGGHGDHPETPLSKIMPPLVAIPRQVVTTAVDMTGKAAVGVATSGTVKDLVTSFAEKVRGRLGGALAHPGWGASVLSGWMRTFAMHVAALMDDQ